MVQKMDFVDSSFDFYFRISFVCTINNVVYNPTNATHRNCRSKLQNISEVSILSIRQIQELLFVESNKKYNLKYKLSGNGHEPSRL